jgi:hypothetical protein
MTQEAKYIVSWPSTTSAWAGWSRFDIPVDRSDGVHSLLHCTSISLGSPTCHTASQQEILFEQNIKKRTGIELCVLCASDSPWNSFLKKLTSKIFSVLTIETINSRILSSKMLTALTFKNVNFLYLHSLFNSVSFQLVNRQPMNIGNLSLLKCLRL